MKLIIIDESHTILTPKAREYIKRRKTPLMQPREYEELQAPYRTHLDSELGNLLAKAMKKRLDTLTLYGVDSGREEFLKELEAVRRIRGEALKEAA